MKFVDITLRRIWVDTRIAPVVQWLNSYSSIFTVESSGYGDEQNENPYVLFICLKPDHLRDVISHIQMHRYGDYGQITLDATQGNLQYRLVFYGKEKLDLWLKNYRSKLNLEIYEESTEEEEEDALES